MILDITKQWYVYMYNLIKNIEYVQCYILINCFTFFYRTFAYIQRELPLVPNHIPILVLANHRDMGHHRTVTEDQVKYFIEGLER